MKRILLALVALPLIALIAWAGVDDRDYAVSTTGANNTNTVTYALHGLIEAIKVDVAASATSTVTVTSDELTLLNVSSVAADTTYFPLATAHTTAGAAADVDTSAGTTNQVFVKQPVSGNVSVRVIGGSAGTNTTTVTILYSR